MTATARRPHESVSRTKREHGPAAAPRRPANDLRGSFLELGFAHYLPQIRACGARKTSAFTRGERVCYEATFGGTEVAIDLSSLKSERDRLKDTLREIEGELRRLEAELKGLRQREIATKREIEALATLIELGDARESKPGE
jgi:hypothetical protein